MRELRTVIGYFIGRLGITSIPEYLREEVGQTISEINVGREFSRIISEFNERVENIEYNNNNNNKN